MEHVERRTQLPHGLTLGTHRKWPGAAIQRRSTACMATHCRPTSTNHRTRIRMCQAPPRDECRAGRRATWRHLANAARKHRCHPPHIEHGAKLLAHTRRHRRCRHRLLLGTFRSPLSLLYSNGTTSSPTPTPTCSSSSNTTTITDSNQPQYMATSTTKHSSTSNTSTNKHSSTSNTTSRAEWAHWRGLTGAATQRRHNAGADPHARPARDCHTEPRRPWWPWAHALSLCHQLRWHHARQHAHACSLSAERRGRRHCGEGGTISHCPR